MLQRIIQMLWLFGLACVGEIAGHSELAPATDDLANYQIHRWTTEDGLPQNHVACIQQTRDGYLWLGTWAGLARFDGVRFAVFNQDNTPAFANNTITALTEDNDGALWIGTKDGLVKYSGGTFHRFTTAEGLPNQDIAQLARAAGGGIWLQSGNEIVRGVRDKFTTVWKFEKGNSVRDFDEGADGRLNIFLNDAWLEVSESGMAETNYSEPDLPPLFPNGVRFWTGITDTNGAALLSTPAGLIRVQRGDTNRVFIGNFLNRPVGLLMRDGSGNIWGQWGVNCATKFSGTNWTDFDLAAAAGDMVCALQDQQGNLWLGTVNGLVQLRFQQLRVFTSEEGLPDDNVWTVCQSADGAIWAGTDRGPVMIQSNRIETAGILTNNSAGPIHCVWPARDGGTWVASQNESLVKIQNGRVVVEIQHPGLPSALYEDGSGRLWIATKDGPVSVYQNGRLEPPAAGTESLRDVHAIFQDHRGDFWFDTRDGLARWQDGKLSIFGPQNGLRPGRVWSICEDTDGTLWLGTEKGLVRLAAGKSFQFNGQHQMPADTVNCVLADDADCLWLSTLHGIYRVERGQLNAVAAGKATRVQPFILGTADGMKTSESNGEAQPAGWKARDGRLWFPTGKGLVMIDPKHFAVKENPPRVLVESLRADGAELSGDADGKIKIAAGHGHALEFNFNACDLSAPDTVRFQTRLAGVSDTWSEPTANRTVNYFNLRPGNYRFEVKAGDHHGPWSGAPAALEFSIAPCFWQTRWFYFACGSGLIFLAAGIQAYRLRWQHRLLKLEQQRALANERARIARDLHDDLGTALTGMALELDVLGRDAQNNLSLVDRLAKASQHTRQLAERMREVVWMVNPRCDNLRSLADFLEDQAAVLLRAADLKVHLDFPLEIPEQAVRANVRHQLALSVREAFNNLIRHARATEASVRLELTAELLCVVIRDNGRGFMPDPEFENEHGLSNMRVRLEEIAGSFQCESAPGKGTTITFRVPLQKTPANKKS